MFKLELQYVDELSYVTCFIRVMNEWEEWFALKLIHLTMSDMIELVQTLDYCNLHGTGERLEEFWIKH